jgi:hypothetical protein
MSRFTSFLSHHTRSALIGGVAVAALAVGGVAYAVTDPGGSTAKAAAPAVTSPSATTPATVPDVGPKPPKGKSHGAKKQPEVTGTITAINGGTWTVKTAKGTSLSVTVTGQTAFGPAKKPTTASAFAVGAPVGIVGTTSGSTVTATRIMAAKASAGSSASPPTTVAP